MAAAAVVANPAAVAPLEEVAADKVVVEADVHPAAVAAARAEVVADVHPAVVVADKAVVEADAHPAVVAEADKVAAGVVVDGRPVVVEDKVVEEADAHLAVAAGDPVVVEWEEEAVVDVLPAVAGAAAETASSLSSSGASRIRGAPFFC